MQPKALNGVGNMISAAFRQSEPVGVQRFASIPLTSQLQGDLLNAADAITTNMTSLLQELDQGMNSLTRKTCSSSKFRRILIL
jgi:hypothetical protein